MGLGLFKHMNLSKKMTLSFVLLALIPVAIVTFLVETAAFDDHISEINTHNRYTANLKAGALGDLLISQKNAMLTLAASSDVTSMDRQSQINALKRLAQNSPEVSNAFICDTNGQQIARDSGNYVNVSDRDYIKAVLKDGKPFAFSDATLSKATNKMMIIAAVPIKDEAGNVIGAIASTFNMGTLEEYLFSGIGHLDDRHEIIYLTDTKGNVMIHPDKRFTENVTNWSSLDPIKNAMAGSVTTTRYVNGSENECLAASVPIKDLNWCVVVETPMDDVTSAIYKSILTVAGIVLILLIIAAIFARLLTNSFVNPLKQLAEKTVLMANGDLTVKLDVDRNDEIGHVADAFNTMIEQLGDVIEKITVAAQQVASGSKNISDSGNSLSTGATVQASSVEELSASISEIASQTRSNAANAGDANDLAMTCKSNAEIGNKDMNDMLTAMNEINAASANISKIIKVIDEIAFQTNILSLNAAVEAARAGQHGKGFAVVAEEVRNLAARSAKAAKETTDMIENSIAKVNEGQAIANKTAEMLTTIVGNVSQVADLVGAIAKASNEQNLAIEQINQGVLQVSQVVQSNSSTAQESAAASVELSAQAELLQEAVSRFRV